MLVALAFQSISLADDPSGRAPPTPDYMRYAEDARSARLETAIRSLTLPSGQQVDLIGVVHIADDAYYQKLNQRFDRYSSVLFELVGNPARLTTTAPALLRQQMQLENPGLLTTLQMTAGRYLGLTFQLGEIDYTKRNMVHADASAEDFARMQRERGENMLTLFARAMNSQMNGGLQTMAVDDFNLFGLIRILMSPNAAAEFKKVLARAFDGAESATALIDGESGSAVLSDRNGVAMKKIREVLASPRQRRIAVLYGAAHMPGIEAMLIENLHARPVKEEWLAAWTMAQ